ncbi:MAG TPA: HEAT repeat domain-containing protein [Verrucomicrobiae bacterium]|nr:HEAT repeat domain-containing protein [Verrucomicrobiae bacterium]
MKSRDEMGKLLASMDHIEALIEKLRSGDDKAKQAAAEALGAIGVKAVPALIASFREAELESLYEFEDAFEKIGRVAVPFLVRALESSDRNTRLVATIVLSEFEGAAAPAVPAFLAGLANADAETRALCAQGLGRIGPKARRALPSLLKAADDQEADVRSNAVFALSRIGLSNDQGKAIFAKAIVDLGGNVRGQAILCAAELVTELAAVLPQLIALLDDVSLEAWRQSMVFELIAQIGPKAKEAIPKLLSLMQDKAQQSRVRFHAAGALWKIDSSSGPIIETLVELLPSNPEGVSNVLYEIGPAAARAVPALVKLLNEDDDYDTKWAVVCTLGAIGRAAEPAIPALIQALGHASGRVASCAAKALQEIGNAAISPLIEALRDPNPAAREYAADALALMGPQAGVAVPALEQGLEDRARRVRFWCAVAIGSIAKSPKAIPTLLEALVKSEDASLAARVWETLDKVVEHRENGGWKLSLLRAMRTLPLPQTTKQKLTFRTCAKLAREYV